VQLATDTGQPDVTAGKALQASDAPIQPSANRIARLDGAGSLILGSAIWRLGVTPIDMDFAGTSYDSKAKCQSVGLRFSDDDTPFTTFETWNATWSHTTGRGWSIDSTPDHLGCLLIPLMRPGNWTLQVQFDYTYDSDLSHQGDFYMGYLTQSGQVGARARIFDGNPSVRGLTAWFYTNNGDDTFTQRYTGSVLSAHVVRTYAFSCRYGSVGVWDEQSSSWYWYNGAHSSGLSAYTPAYAYIKMSNRSSAVWNIYISSLLLYYG